jgi:nitrite reductase/ring-hydroxylating ferredoxin subunit
MSEVDVGSVADFPDGSHRILAIGEFEVGIFRRGAKFIAYENVCPHHGGPVCQGKIINRVEEDLRADKTSNGLRFSKDENIICPWHGYEFNLMTGVHPGDPNVRLTPVAVDVRADRLYVTLAD